MDGCMYLCLYVFWFVRMYVCVYAREVCTYPCCHARLFASMHFCMYSRWHACMFESLYACTHVCMFEFVCMHAWMYVCLCVHIHARSADTHIFPCLSLHESVSRCCPTSTLICIGICFRFYLFPCIPAQTLDFQMVCRQGSSLVDFLTVPFLHISFPWSPAWMLRKLSCGLVCFLASFFGCGEAG